MWTDPRDTNYPLASLCQLIQEKRKKNKKQAPRPKCYAFILNKIPLSLSSGYCYIKWFDKSSTLAPMNVTLLGNVDVFAHVTKVR